MWGHQSAKLLGSSYPQFLAEADGVSIRDVDGHSYIDLLCGYGPIILGYRRPEVEAAADRQRRLADCQNAPSRLAVDLAELLVDTISHADWAILAKNGTDATTACLTIARCATGRSIILAARGAYHGAAPWCTPSLEGVLGTDRAAIRYYDYNDLASVQAVVEDADGDLAGVIVTPFKHFEGLDQELVDPGFAQGLRQICDRTGAALILDDVRCGFRMAVDSSWEPLGVRPDLSAWSKAIGNGYPIAAIVGSDALRDAAARPFLTGSFWFSAVPMAAAHATISLLRQGDALTAMMTSGNILKAGVLRQAASFGLAVRYTGVVTMPYMTFTEDTNYERMQLFAERCLSVGLYLHPRHNWFLSDLHTPAVIGRVLEMTETAFAAVAQEYGKG